MRFSNLEKASDYEIRDWLKKEIKLNQYQMDQILLHELIRFAPFEFYKPKKKVKNFWFRFTIVFIPIVWILLFIGLPFNFFITGKWGFGERIYKFYYNWVHKLNL